ncbi:hypothetical protein ACFOD4_16935 [Pseudoroseomonas globiformis]|uniref:Phasin domain-containing protein n=1 Tax=Teichococcus globiformis TaxID=2307229 RepID=A0ABV7G218_9PROT
MTRSPSTMPRLLRHGDNVVEMIRGAHQVMQSRLSAEEAALRGPALTALEFGRMVPEKMLAFSSVQTAMWQGGLALMQRTMEYGFQEAAAQQALVRSGAQKDPAALAAAQLEWATGATHRAARFWTGFGQDAMAMAESSLRPVRSAVTSNRRRLG